LGRAFELLLVAECGDYVVHDARGGREKKLGGGVSSTFFQIILDSSPMQKHHGDGGLGELIYVLCSALGISSYMCPSEFVIRGLKMAAAILPLLSLTEHGYLQASNDAVLSTCIKAIWRIFDSD
jgi:hypothetical protein